MSNLGEQYRTLRSQSIELKHQGKWLERIPVQKRIIEVAQHLGPRHAANAWASLAHLYHQTRQYPLAEKASRTALSLHDESQKNPEEQLATLQFQLAVILAAQERFAEAIEIGETAIGNFSVLHDPPTAFLDGRIAEVEEMRKFRDGHTKPRDNTTAHRTGFRPSDGL